MNPADWLMTPWMRTRRRESSSSVKRARRGAPGRGRTGAGRGRRERSGRVPLAGRVLAGLPEGVG